MNSRDTTQLFDFLFGEQGKEEVSEAGRQAKLRLEHDLVQAAERDVSRAEELFQQRPSPDSAYELGECYQQLIEAFSGREHLAQRKGVKRKLLRLLEWMERSGIELGDAVEVLKSLQIEFSYQPKERAL